MESLCCKSWELNRSLFVLFKTVNSISLDQLIAAKGCFNLLSSTICIIYNLVKLLQVDLAMGPG